MMSDDPRVEDHLDAVKAYAYARQQLGRALAGDDFDKVRMWEKARMSAWELVNETLGLIYYRDDHKGEAA